jgi:hypothetical protein
MFTIGGLSNHLALPLKITICWELLTIMLLEFYLISLTFNFKQPLAGNQHIISNILVGTPETKRNPHNKL